MKTSPMKSWSFAIALAAFAVPGAAAAQSNTDATLSALVINDGAQDVTLTKTGGATGSGFAAGHETYAAAQVEVRVITLTPSATAAGATIQAGKLGATLRAVTSGAEAMQVLRIGANTLALEVTAPDGMTAKTYHVTITRSGAPHNDAALSSLMVFDIDDEMELADINLAANAQRTYTLNVPHKADGIDFTAVPADENFHAMVMTVAAQTSPPLAAIRDADVVGPGFSETLRLTPGMAREVVFSVTAEDQSSVLTYSVRVTREEAGATPAVTLIRDYYYTDENQPLDIGVRLSAPAAAAGAVVTFTFSGDADLRKVQYTTSPESQLTFAAGESEKSITLIPLDNEFLEEDNTDIEIALGVPRGYQEGARIRGVIDVYDDESDDRAVVVFGDDISRKSAYTATLNEGETFFLPVTIGAAAVDALRFNAHVLRGSASGGVGSGGRLDYHISIPYVLFEARDAVRSRSVSIDILEDLDMEDAETIVLRLASDTDGLGRLYEDTPAATAVLTIAASDINDDARLNALVPSVGAGELAPRFAADTESYTLAVPHATASIRFLPDKKESEASVMINNAALVSGASVEIALTAGVALAIPVVVTAPDGITTKTYTVTATRATASASADASLISLSAHAGTFELTLSKTGDMTTPGFEAAHETYATPEVAHTFAGITLSPRATEPNARITIGGADVPSGGVSPSQPLVFGENPIALVVTAQDAVTTKTYELAVARAAGPPLAPRDFSISEEDLALLFNWSRHIDDNGAEISGYKVRWKRADASAYAARDIADTRNIPLRVPDVFFAGIAYTAQAAAVNAIGTGAWSEEQSGMQARSKPSAPRNVTPTAGDGALQLAWTPPESAGGEALSGYRARWRLADDNGRPGAWQKSSGVTTGPADGEIIAAPAAAYIITGLTNDAAYQAQVAAVNSLGVSVWSAAQSGTPFAAGRLDMDKIGGVTWQDGVLIARYLLGLRNADLTDGLTLAPASTPQDNIAAAIADMSLDVDGNNAITAADGILIARYLLGVRGAALIEGQTDMQANVVEAAAAALAQ
ncbi:MAG: cadherin-like beta sandwich domain-containing protein [Gammaproteobacteria bacterium]